MLFNNLDRLKLDKRMDDRLQNRIVSIKITTAPYRAFIEEIIDMGRKRLSSYTCVANVHMVVEAHRNKGYAALVNSADLVTPDGMPLVMGLKLLHGIDQERVAGMDLVPDLLKAASDAALSVFLYGSTTGVLQAVIRRIEKEHPWLTIAGHLSPPFRPLTCKEEEDEISMINDSGAHVVLVALGCPKQEIWMASRKGRIQSTMIGVGGAFPVYAGIQSRAPAWMQKCSLEWFYRLCQEPARLFSRYLTTNSLFLLLLLRDLYQLRLRSGKTQSF
jgi:N-acetylglucosaminyldiphosphoundecaprenol N-acetyl-beta-D-mannosaminyltransferase